MEQKNDHREQGKRRGPKPQKRSPNDKKQFKCPCGKQYFSYPALFTHIKQNHGKNAPGIIIRPNDSKFKVVGASKIDEHNKIVEVDIKINPIIELLEYLKLNPVLLDQNKQIMTKLVVYNEIYCAKHNPEPEYEADIGIYDVKLTHGVYLFLQELETQKKFFQQVDTNICTLILILMLQFITQQCQDRDVLLQAPMSFLPLHANRFMLKKGWNSVQQLFNNKLSLSESSLIRIMNYIFKWMFYKKYTLTTVSINHQYLLQQSQINQQNIQQKIQQNNEASQDNQKQNNEVSKHNQRQKQKQQ